MIDATGSPDDLAETGRAHFYAAREREHAHDPITATALMGAARDSLDAATTAARQAGAQVSWLWTIDRDHAQAERERLALLVATRGEADDVPVD